jgi:hypothetical protein
LVGCLINEFVAEDTKPVDKKVHDKFIDVVLTEIDNYTKKTEWKNHSGEIPSADHETFNKSLHVHTIRIYMDLQKSTIFALPSESTMRKKDN